MQIRRDDRYFSSFAEDLKGPPGFRICLEHVGLVIAFLAVDKVMWPSISALTNFNIY
jgi:hypothetical protein